MLTLFFVLIYSNTFLVNLQREFSCLPSSSSISSDFDESSKFGGEFNCKQGFGQFLLFTFDGLHRDFIYTTHPILI